MRRHHYALHAVAIVAAVAAVVLGLSGAFTRPQRSPADVLDVTAQRHIAEQAAVAPSPNCRVAAGAGQLGACAPRQALALAQALAPQANAPSAATTLPGPLAVILPPLAEATGLVDRGEDVSSYQGCAIDWRSRPYVHWVVAKDDEGGGYHDTCAAHNVASALAAGKPVGTYFFARNTVSPDFSADRQAQDDRSVGADPRRPGVLPSTLDYEANDGGLSPAAECAWIGRYIRRYEADTHTSAMLLYSAAGTYPPGGCAMMPPGTLLWDAAYGPAWNVLRPFAATAAWQYSDGQYGPTPHLDAGDSDIWLGSHASLVALAQHAPPAPPVDPRFRFTCSELDALTWERRHHPRRFSRRQHRRAVALRADLRRHRVGCTRPPHSTAYPYPQRRGALA